MKTKKISWQAIAIVVLALVLIASIALGVSGAWFQDNDAVQQTSKMGDPVSIRLGDTSATDEVETWSKLYTSTNPYPGDTIMGHTQVYMRSATPSVVRGTIIVSVKDADGGDVTLPEVTTDSLTAPTKPNKSDDTYWTTDTNGNTTFNESAYNTAVSTYETEALTYDKQMLARMLAVTLAGNTNWEKGATTYYYFKQLADNTKTIELFDALKLDTSLSNQVAKWTISVKVSVEAIQAANLSENTTWYSDLGTTIKSAVDTYNSDRTVDTAD